MRPLFAAAAILAATAFPALADGPSWPIRAAVDYPEIQAVAPAAGGTATVRVAVDADASNIEIEVYGLDGMRAGTSNDVRVHADRLPAGGSLSFSLDFQPGPGRSSLVVVAKAAFARGVAGGPVLDFPFGVENAEQLAEHSRCVRQDPEGVWIREMGCEEPAPLAAARNAPPTLPPTLAQAVRAAPGASLAAPPVLTIAQARTALPGQIVRLVGYVIEGYRCPPCPRGAQCKPCISHSAIFLAETPSHAPFALDNPPADILAIATPDPEPFLHGVSYRIEFTAAGGRSEGIDGNLLRSQRPELEPIWTDNLETIERPGVVEPVK